MSITNKFKQIILYFMIFVFLCISQTISASLSLSLSSPHSISLSLSIYIYYIYVYKFVYMCRERKSDKYVHTKILKIWMLLISKISSLMIMHFIVSQWLFLSIYYKCSWVIILKVNCNSTFQTSSVLNSARNTWLKCAFINHSYFNSERVYIIIWSMISNLSSRGAESAYLTYDVVGV